MPPGQGQSSLQCLPPKPRPDKAVSPRRGDSARTLLARVCVSGPGPRSHACAVSGLGPRLHTCDTSGLGSQSHTGLSSLSQSLCHHALPYCPGLPPDPSWPRAGYAHVASGGLHLFSFVPSPQALAPEYNSQNPHSTRSAQASPQLPRGAGSHVQAGQQFPWLQGAPGSARATVPQPRHTPLRASVKGVPGLCLLSPQPLERA